MKLRRRAEPKGRCPFPGCENDGLPTGWTSLVDLCSSHAADRDLAAENARVEVALLEYVRYDGMAPKGYYSENPCRGCGHPWFAHCTTAFYDGRCQVAGCSGCQGEEGQTPGYLPGVLR